MADGTEKAGILASKEALETALIEAYEDETERDNARKVMYETLGLDENGNFPDDKKDPPEPEKPAQQQAADADKPAGDDAPDPNKELQDKIAALEARLSERDDRLAELEAKTNLAASGDDIAKKVDEALAAKRDEFAAAEAREKAELAKAREEHGEEVAKTLETLIADNAKLRAQQLEDLRKAETAKLTAVREDEVTAEAKMSRDIAAVPDLKKWHDDAMSGKPGMYQLAHGVDQTLLDDPEWRTKPRAERFAEVARRVTTMVAAINGPQGGDKPGDSKGKTQKEIEAEIARQAKAKGVTDDKAPLTLSDLTGGEPKSSVFERLDDMDTADIASLGLTTDQIDKILTQREAHLTLQ